jgi:uncharacterized protein (TIGR02145 family)
MKLQKKPPMKVDSRAFPLVTATNNNGVFNDMGGNGYFWSSSEGNSSEAWYRILRYNLSDVYPGYEFKQVGFSVRCLGD